MRMRYIIVFALLASIVFLYSFRERENSLENEVKTILIDPGHGGKDKGSTWDTLAEKDLVLDFCRYFEKVNINPGYKLVFLRNTDEYFTFNGRVEKINQINPDIIISIHHSMNVDSTLSGLQVFYCRESYNSERSLQLAKKVMGTLPKDIPIINSPEHANFLVLRDTNCPGILLEVGYLTNEHDRAVITSEKYRLAFAQAVIDAIQN